MDTSTHHRRWIFGIRRRVAGAVVALAIVLMLAVVATPSAQAQWSYAYSVLYSFKGGTDGEGPNAVVLDAQGNLYGATSEGGASGAGTVFKVDPTGKETVLYTFTGGADGASPWGGVVLDTQGNMYSTTFGGGAYGQGTVFKVDPSGNETTLYSFTGGPDGGQPRAGVVLDAQGNLYGTASAGGGGFGYGTVFKVDPSGNETVLHTFTGPPDGFWPSAGLFLDAQGNLYGTTSAGGTDNNGAVFKVDPSGNETVLYSFGNKPDGQEPLAGLVMDLVEGHYLYGTTAYGGFGNRGGKGTVFWVDSQTGEEAVFDYFVRGRGSYPIAGLVVDPVSGNVYGTACTGGTYNRGTVFWANPYTGDLGVLHTFSGKKGDGACPDGSLALYLQASGRNVLYGTTASGGAYGWGTVFKMMPATATSLTSSPNPSDYGQAVTFTTVVAPAPPDGETVTFMKGKAVLGTGPLSGGTAIFTTAALRVGKTSVTAVYGGDSNFAGSTSKAVKQVVDKYPTTTALSSSLNPSQSAQAVTFTAQVTSSGAPPTGIVKFLDGASKLGLDRLRGGVASFTTSKLAVGTHAITAQYLGDAASDKSTSPVLDQVVQ